VHRTIIISLALAVGNVALAAPSNNPLSAVQNAFECKQRLANTPAIRTVLGNKEKTELHESDLNGNYTLSQPIKVFGFEIHQVQISENNDTGTSYSFTLAKSELKNLAQAAKLKPNDGRYYRTIKGGHIEAGNSSTGNIALSCIWAG